MIDLTSCDSWANDETSRREDILERDHRFFIGLGSVLIAWIGVVVLAVAL